MSDVLAVGDLFHVPLNVNIQMSRYYSILTLNTAHLTQPLNAVILTLKGEES